ncbi:RdgB/HAM1 family non-canonical purine NTP pyrophosphatase [Rheinheimera tangshanensis]|uniref:dITP/XTP pyrophosphatase n=1 Tax=Rheinheimera tangshanensis TaxID=400153 RepID=A0A5C8M119_9GAMM|nr:RdgB/HAM1 family non-canonical purine NTP pyrophosphatase [Rheinheimera tangshanensis]TXK81598.1 RdgB/HAM1 family non-canonical purine NTP pyrophosphatase [Rheinheimera tangshanensis]GGM56707.1 dITP/XTP pyrophosphatase [Rheinheimera tangshanensis]
MQKLVLATGNKGKLAELSALLAPFDWQVLPQSDFQVPDAIEDGLSFIENALIKARHASRLTGLPAIADDSGLAVDALGGAPGIYSARYAGEHGNDLKNLQQLLVDLKDIPQGERAAQFHCVLAFVRHADDPVPVIAHGIWHGQIAFEATGSGGFGYDPIFLPNDSQGSAAELTAEQKKQLSHRGKALRLLVSLLKGEPLKGDQA